MNEFEQRLRRLPVRKLPADWRAEILAAAAPVRTAAPVNGLVLLRARLLELFWPHPKAWAGLAAAWAIILLLNLSATDRAPVLVKKSAAPSPDVIEQLHHQQIMFAELIGTTVVSDKDRIKTGPLQPHTYRRETFAL